MIIWHIDDRCEQKFIFLFHSNLRKLTTTQWRLMLLLSSNISNVYVQKHFQHVFITFVLKTKYLNAKINILTYLPVICDGENINTCIVNSIHKCYLQLCIGSLPLKMTDFGVFAGLILALSWEVSNKPN